MSSPKPKAKAKKSLTFTKALTELLTGKSITKLEWDDKACYGFLNEERLRLHKPDGIIYDWIISEGDLRGDDWVAF